MPLLINLFLKYEVEVALLVASSIFLRGQSRPLLVLLERHHVIFDRLGKVASLVLAGTSRVCCVDVVWVQLEDHVVVCDRFIDLALLFICASSDIIRTGVIGTEVHQLIAVSDSLVEHAFLQER